MLYCTPATLMWQEYALGGQMAVNKKMRLGEMLIKAGVIHEFNSILHCLSSVNLVAVLVPL